MATGTSLHSGHEQTALATVVQSRLGRERTALVWVAGLEGHIQKHGYEASKVDSRKPRMYIQSGLDLLKRIIRLLRAGVD